MTEKNMYPERDSRELGTYYTDHLLAMTAEGLHHKSDIATQLAWRDKELDETRALLASLLEGADEKGELPTYCSQLTLGGTISWRGERCLITKLARSGDGIFWSVLVTFNTADKAQVTLQLRAFDPVPK